MKKTLSLIVALILCLSLCACGGENNAPETTTTTQPITITLSAREQLTDLEEKLFNNLIAITKESFYEPAAVRVLEVCDYKERSKYETPEFDDLLYGPDTIVVRLQGENRVDGTLNHYYLICLKAAENKDENIQELIKSYNFLGHIDWRMRYSATEGEYIELSDSYSPEKDASGRFNIGQINKALKEYWEEMGF